MPMPIEVTNTSHGYRTVSYTYRLHTSELVHAKREDIFVSRSYPSPPLQLAGNEWSDPIPPEFVKLTSLRQRSY